MMFFALTKRKLISTAIVLTLLILGVIATVFLNAKWQLTEASSLYSRNLKENIRYWVSNKLLNFGARNTIVYTNNGKIAKSIPVLVYHGIPNEGSGDNPFQSPNFLEQMKTLKASGWQTISLDQFYAFVQGDLELPEHSFLLTFDDGRKDTYYPADPVLKDLGFRAVMFAITKRSLSPDSSQSTYYLSEFELRQMQKSGRWDIESHGRDSHDWYTIDASGSIGHFFSNLFWVDATGQLESSDEFKNRVIYDLANSKKDLETVLNKEVLAFAFPFGDYGESITNFEDAKGILLGEVPKYYKMAFYQAWISEVETFNYPSKSQFMFKRIEPASSLSGADLALKLEEGLAKEMPYKAENFGQEWVGGWGGTSAGEALQLKAEADTTGASAGLSGSWWWSDYTFSTDVDWQSGSNIVLVARKQDAGNYYGCNFGGKSVSIKKATNGSSYNLLTQNYNLASLGKELNIGIRVNGSSVSCLVNGQVITKDNVNSNLPNGSIGVEVWDQEEGVAEATFDNVTVDPII